MEQTREITTILRGATRRMNTADGNPVWMLHTTDGDYATERDAQVGFEVPNLTDPNTDDYLLDREVVLTVRGFGRGRVIGVAAKGVTPP